MDNFSDIILTSSSSQSESSSSESSSSDSSSSEGNDSPSSSGSRRSNSSGNKIASQEIKSKVPENDSDYEAAILEEFLPPQTNH